MAFRKLKTRRVYVGQCKGCGIVFECDTEDVRIWEQFPLPQFVASCPDCATDVLVSSHTLVDTPERRLW